MQRRSPRVGRRTGVNIFQGKTIRTLADGKDVFEDYWTSSDGESSKRDHQASYASTLMLTPDKRVTRKTINSQNKGDESINSNLKANKIEKNKFVLKNTTNNVPEDQLTPFRKRKFFQEHGHSKIYKDKDIECSTKEVSSTPYIDKNMSKERPSRFHAQINNDQLPENERETVSANGSKFDNEMKILRKTKRAPKFRKGKKKTQDKQLFEDKRASASPNSSKLVYQETIQSKDIECSTNKVSAVQNTNENVSSAESLNDFYTLKKNYPISEDRIDTSPVNNSKFGTEGSFQKKPKNAPKVGKGKCQVLDNQMLENRRDRELSVISKRAFVIQSEDSDSSPKEVSTVQLVDENMLPEERPEKSSMHMKNDQLSENRIAASPVAISELGNEETIQKKPKNAPKVGKGKKQILGNQIFEKNDQLSENIIAASPAANSELGNEETIQKKQKNARKVGKGKKQILDNQIFEKNDQLSENRIAASPAPNSELGNEETIQKKPKNAPKVWKGKKQILDNQIFENLRDSPPADCSQLANEGINKKSKNTQKVGKRKKQILDNPDEPAEKRRSNRNRGPPLAIWRNEYKSWRYDPKTNDFVFLGVQKGSKEDDYGIRAEKRRQEYVQKKKVEQKHKKAFGHDIKVKSSTGKNIKLPLSKPFSTLDWKPDKPENPAYTLTKTFQCDYGKISYGFINILPDKTKPSQYSPLDNTHFIVLTGSVEVVIHKTVRHYSKHDGFLVPFQTAYLIKNTGIGNALLSYSTSREAFFRHQTG